MKVLSTHHWTASTFLHFIHFSKQPKGIGITSEEMEVSLNLGLC